MIKTTQPNTSDVGDFAPDFSLPSLGSKEVRLSDFRGRSVAVFFWDSW
ncbi:peroxiredoxin family protein [Dehalococcoidia bacterium]|nr:peroxiredoxin family protein [Dehalococcoidia bacterium]